MRQGDTSRGLHPVQLRRGRSAGALIVLVMAGAQCRLITGVPGRAGWVSEMGETAT